MAVSTEELKKALISLQNALKAPKTDITRDAAIQRFEFTLELAWKTSKKKMGSASSAPKVVIREMAQSQLIDDPAPWFEFLEARNLSSHTYKEGIAEKVFDQARIFSVHCQDLLARLREDAVTAPFGLLPEQWEAIEKLAIGPLKLLGAKVWVFGSRATGKFRKFSDLDLLYESGEGLPIRLQEVSAIREALEESSLPVKIDLVDFRELPESFRSEALKARIAV